MSDPLNYKTALATALVAALGPDLGQHAVIVLGGTAGGYLSVWMQDPMTPWWRAYVHVFNGVVAALLFASGVTLGLDLLLRDRFNYIVPADLFWLPVSALTAIFWRDALGLARRWSGRLFSKRPT